MDPSDSQARTLVTVLRFLDLEPVHVHDLKELREYQRSSAHDWLAVIVAQETVATQGAELVEQLRSIAQPLPVIYLSSDGLPKSRRPAATSLGFTSNFRSNSGACRRSWIRRKTCATAIRRSRAPTDFVQAVLRARCARCIA